MTEVNFENVGFVYKMWYYILDFIEKLLPFSLVRKYIFKETKNFSDKWVLFNTTLSFLTLLLLHYNLIIDLGFVILVYAMLRILEIMVYQINVLLFHPYKTLVVKKQREYKIQNPFRSVVLLGHNLVEVIFWFTALTSYVYPSNDRLLFKLMDNIIRILTLNYEKLSVNQGTLQIIIFFEVLCGLILTIISLAKFIGELPHVHLKKEK